MIEAKGWNTWDVRHLNAVVLLPSQLRIIFSLADPATGEVKDDFGWRENLHRLGPHTTDGSYCRIDLKWDQAVVSFEYAAQGDRLVCRVTQDTTTPPLALGINVDGAWGAELVAGAHGFITNKQQATWNVGVARVARVTDDGKVRRVEPHVPATFTLAAPVLVEATPGEFSNVDSMLAFIDQQRSAYAKSGLSSDGWLAEAAEALTRAIAWNTIWEPIKGRVCTPVSRDWCKGPFFGSYVLFDWDTFFCAVMAQLEDPQLATANALAILQEVSAAGFVPNFGCEFGPSEDRSQPPVGAYCVLKLYRASALANAKRGRELLERAFPVLSRWHAWWMPHRDGNHDGLLEWGSDSVPGYRDDWQSNNMQAAMYESGLDNSPMYDEAVYNPQTHTMELADVGLNALYAMDAWALSEIARELDQPTLSQNFATEYAEMAQRINAEMWSDEAGIYLNKHWDGRFSPHLSPTLFYPLIAGIAPRERAERMVREHLLNEREFWGQYVMPSIARSDPGYAGNDYWRGRIWGPMNFLVSEGLRRYRFDDVAHQFARRGLDLLLQEWRAEGHVHENYNTDTGDGDDVPSSDPMYTWGALLGYVAVQELVDCEPWNGWRFGNLSGEPASLRGVRVSEGTLDVDMGRDGLRVSLNGTLIIATDRPVLITGYQRTRSRLIFQIPGVSETPGIWMRVGNLPPSRRVQVKQGTAPAVEMATDELGTVQFSVNAPCTVEIEF